MIKISWLKSDESSVRLRIQSVILRKWLFYVKNICVPAEVHLCFAMIKFLCNTVKVIGEEASLWHIHYSAAGF